MAKKKKVPLTDQEARLKKKVTEKRGKLENPEGAAPFRKLHKRLKRIQRLRRRLATRKQHAMGKKKADAAAKPAAPAA
ncbi:MAG: hypothetical protein A3H49_01325 [Nitrospirae bacterium RIFCSPLOWO2_02_FULL_62_14]|nr:MAG: hypothetical protein A3H49_01325 [Nitrospirae bacterium RIFCSPLOWO2_02_FULL_62_14]OGW70595.1 MAG: hypothetical protein A3A88_07255 [Nitrospirae bacterium RIFCSPLOWO2_01_FULL_62_17]